MSLAAPVAIAVLFATATYLLLSPNVQRIAIGFLLLSNGVNLLVLTAGGLPVGASPPIITENPAGPYADPLPQAFVLTAIVISLGTSAWVLAMALGLHRSTGSDELTRGGE